MASPQLMPGATGPGQAPSHGVRVRRWNHRSQPSRGLGVCCTWTPEGSQHSSAAQPALAPPQQPSNVEQLDGPSSRAALSSRRSSSSSLLLATRPAPPSPPSGQPQIQKPTWVSGPVMLWKIKNTDTWEALWEVVNEHQQQFTYVHISAAIVHFTRLVNHGSGRLSRRPSQRYTSPGLSTPFNSACSPLSSQDGANLSEPRTALDLLRQLLAMAIAQLETFDVQGIANTMHSLAVLRHHDTSMLQSLLAAVQYRMDTGTPQNLSNIIWACVTLGFTPDRDWMGLYYDAIDTCISQFRPQDIANTLWAFGRLEFNGTQYKVAPDIVGKLLQQAYPQLADFSPQHLANSMWGLARLRFVPSPAWCQAFLAVSQHQMPAMQPEELCSIVWALGRVRLRPPAPWVDSALQVSGSWLRVLDACQLSQLLTSLGSLGAHPPAAWLATALTRSLQVAPSCTPLALAQVLRGVSLLGVHGVQQTVVQSWLDGMLHQAWLMMGNPQPVSASGSHVGTADSPVNGSHNGFNGQDGTTAQSGNSQQVDNSSSRSGSGSSDVSGSNGSNGYSTCQFTAEELGHVLYALTGLRVRLPQPWLSHVYHVLQHSPSLLDSTAKDGKVMSLVVWSISQLISLQQLPSQQQPSAGADVATPSRSSTPPPPTQQQSAPLLRPSSPHPPITTHPHVHNHMDTPTPAQPAQAASTADAVTGAHSQQQQQGAQPSLPPALLLTLAPLTISALRRTYGPHELGVLLRAYAQAGVVPSRLLVYYWWRSLVLLGQGAVNPSALIHQLGSLIQLGQTPHSTWWKGVLRTSARGFAQFRPHHISKLVRYMAQLRYQPDDNWVSRLLLTTYNVWVDMTPGDWSQLLWGLAKLQVHVPSAWMRRFYSTSYSQLSSFQPDQLAVISWAVGKLRVRPSTAWATAFRTASEHQLPAMSAHHLLCCVSGVSRMSLSMDHSWVRAAVVESRHRLQHGLLSPEQEQLLAMAMQRIRTRLAAGKLRKQQAKRIQLPRVVAQRQQRRRQRRKVARTGGDAEVTAVGQQPQPGAGGMMPQVGSYGMAGVDGYVAGSAPQAVSDAVSGSAASGDALSKVTDTSPSAQPEATSRELCSSSVGVAYRST